MTFHRQRAYATRSRPWALQNSSGRGMRACLQAYAGRRNVPVSKHRCREQWLCRQQCAADSKLTPSILEHSILQLRDDPRRQCHKMQITNKSNVCRFAAAKPPFTHESRYCSWLATASGVVKPLETARRRQKIARLPLKDVWDLCIAAKGNETTMAADGPMWIIYSTFW